MNAACFLHESVDDAARQPATEQIGKRSVFGTRILQGGTMCSAGLGFIGQEKGRANLHGIRAELESGAHCGGIADTACGDDRQGNSATNSGEKREGATLQGEIIAQEMTAMAAGFQPLRNDGVHTMCGKPARFGNRSGAGHDFRASGADGGEQLRFGQAEMEADDGRAVLFDKRQRLAVKWLTAGIGGDSAAIHMETRKPWLQGLMPGVASSDIDGAGTMGEEVEVVRRAGRCADAVQFRVQLFRAEHGSR